MLLFHVSFLSFGRIGEIIVDILCHETGKCEKVTIFNHLQESKFGGKPHERMENCFAFSIDSISYALCITFLRYRSSHISNSSASVSLLATSGTHHKPFLSQHPLRRGLPRPCRSNWCTVAPPLCGRKMVVKPLSEVSSCREVNWLWRQGVHLCDGHLLSVGSKQAAQSVLFCRSECYHDLFTCVAS
jgi:hypothetical protein